MKTGTNYFPSYGAALRYYRPYVESPSPSQFGGVPRDARLRRLVDRKLNSGEIHIGKPDLKPGETLTIEDNRYHITEARPLMAPRNSGIYTACDAPGFERGNMGRGKPKAAQIYSVVSVSADGLAECESWDAWGCKHTARLPISTLAPYSATTL